MTEILHLIWDCDTICLAFGLNLRNGMWYLRRAHMKILYYSPHPHLQREAPTGYGTHIREMISAWKRMGASVHTFIAGDRNGTEYGTGSPPKFKSMLRKLIPSIAWESLKDLELVRLDTQLEVELAEVIQNFRPDVIYERVAYLQNSGVRMAAKYGIRHIAEINAPFPEERRSFSGRSFFLSTAENNLREILIKSDCISVVSSALKEKFVTSLPEAEKKIHVISNCVNPAKVLHDTADVDALRQKFGLAGSTIIGFVGSIFPYHGVDILIEAFARLEDQQTKLLIVGDGAMLPELKSLARREGILNRVIFTGSIPHRDIFPMIEIMDICCMARSNWYGSPVKIFEYGLMKKPVIAPDVTPVKDVMSEEDGLFIEPTVESLFSALKRLVDDRELRSTLAENWHQKVLVHHTWDTAAQKILTLCT